MAKVLISLDTVTKEAVLTVDGELVSANSVYFSKGYDFDDQPMVDFAYSVMTSNEKGLREFHSFSLPREADAQVNDHGLAESAGRLCASKAEITQVHDPEVVRSVAQQLHS